MHFTLELSASIQGNRSQIDLRGVCLGVGSTKNQSQRAGNDAGDAVS